MTSPSKLGEHRDGHHVLVVGASPWADQLRKTMAHAGIEPASVRVVEGYLAALGEAAVRQPTVVIGRVDGLGAEAGAVAEGIRQLSPSVRLWLLAKPEQLRAAHEAVQAGFDDYLLEPVQPRALDRVFDIKREMPSRVAPMPDPRNAPDARELRLFDRILTREPNIHDGLLQLLADRSGIATIGLSEKREDVPSERAVAAVAMGEKTFGYLHAPGSIDSAALEAWAAWAARWLATRETVARLWTAAMTDPLTDLFNRRAFDQRLVELVERSRGERSRVTLLIFDVDDFKQYNDQFGHPAGDEVLRETARLIRSQVRPDDIVARIGGDEFAVIFWDAEARRRPDSKHPIDPLAVADRFREALRQHRFPKLAEQALGPLTISGGLATFPWDARDADSLFEAADHRAMESKRSGKNVLSFGQDDS
jgi:diguanylate cyclase (GGDEF)-like protein